MAGYWSFIDLRLLTVVLLVIHCVSPSVLESHLSVTGRLSSVCCTCVTCVSVVACWCREQGRDTFVAVERCSQALTSPAGGAKSLRKRCGCFNFLTILFHQVDPDFEEECLEFQPPVSMDRSLLVFVW